MQLGQMTDGVHRRTGYSTDDGLVTPEVVIDAVNQALRLIASERDWPWLRTSTTVATVANQATYAMPSDWTRSDRILLAGDPIDRYDARQLEDIYGADIGQPRAWAVNDELLVLRPIPNAVWTLTHEYVRNEKTLTSDTETPYLPARWHDAVIELASSFVHEAGRNPDRAGVALERYTKMWLPRMLDDVRRTRGPMRPRIREGSAF